MVDETVRLSTRSVLFTDLVGSTELRVRLGEEAADALRRVHDTLLTEAITEHGGSVVKGLGDGLMATFESAADAVAGAVAAQQTVEVHGRERPEQAFAIRVGVSVGDVSSEGGDVFGVPVVEAARLCGIAGGGEILTADLVRALARGRGDFAFEPMGDVELKGLNELVAACRVIWHPVIESSAASSVPIAPVLVGGATSYIGREQLRDRLTGDWAAARAGTCLAILLAGEPGVGKTRTAAEVARLAFGDGALVLYGRCDEELDLPYQPFVEALEYYVHHADQPVLGRMPGELARLAPELGEAVEGLPAPVRSDPATEEYRLFEAVASWLIDSARGSGLVLVLDDIHWATRPTLKLIQHVIRRAGDETAPMLVLLTYRDTDIDRTHPLAAALGDLRRLPCVDRIAVDNLTNAEVVSFIEVAAGHDLDDEISRLADAVYAETEGNPFFVGEVLRHLIETGAVRRDGDRWVVAKPDQVTVPEGVRDVVGRRLSRLSDNANSVLSLAAVLGRDFEIEILLELTEIYEEQALDALDLAVRARLVEETSADRYRFAHALVRTTLYDKLSATRRRRLHRRVADVLEKLRPDDVRALAHHCVLAGAGAGGSDLGRAVRYTMSAAEQSLAARAFGDAEAGFRSAIVLLEDDDTVGRSSAVAAALCGLGESLRDQGDPGFRQTLLEASAAAVNLGDASLLVRAVLANTRGLPSVIGDLDRERLAFIEAALEMIGPDPTPARARLLGQLASEQTFSADYSTRLVLVDDAVEMARGIGDDDVLGDVLLVTSNASISGRSWESLVPRQAELLRLADASGDPTRRVLARYYYISARLTVGEMQAAEQLTREMVQIADDEGTPIVQWFARNCQIWMLSSTGPLDAAQQAADEMAEVGGRLDQPDAAQFWAAVTSAHGWMRGHLGDFADSATEQARLYPLFPVWRTSEAFYLSEAGRTQESRAVIDDHSLNPQALLDVPLPFTPLFSLAMAAWNNADTELSARVVEALRPYAHCWANYVYIVLGPVSWPLGLCLATTGALDEAIPLLESALAETTARGMHPITPTLGLHLAQVLQLRNADGDHTRATDLLREARVGAEQIDAPAIVARIDAEEASG